MSHHSHSHDSKSTGIAVIFSLLLFFFLTVAGHYVFVLSQDHETPREHFVKSDEHGKPVVKREK